MALQVMAPAPLVTKRRGATTCADAADGEEEGLIDGEIVGLEVGLVDGKGVGPVEGDREGLIDGEVEGPIDGEIDGESEGPRVGCEVFAHSSKPQKLNVFPMALLARNPPPTMQRRGRVSIAQSV